MKPIKGQTTIRSKVSGRTVVKLDLAPVSFKSRAPPAHNRQISMEYSAGEYFVVNHCNAEPCTGMPMRTQRLVKSTDLGPTTVTLDPRLWRSTTACRGSLENFKSLTMGESYSSCRRCTLASSQSSHCRMCTSNPCWCRPPSCTLCDAES